MLNIDITAIAITYIVCKTIVILTQSSNGNKTRNIRSRTKITQPTPSSDYMKRGDN